MIETPKGVIDKWMQAINCGDVESLLNMYDEQAVLTPTFSNRMLNSSEKLKDYFEKLSQREGLSIALHDNTLSTQTLNDDVSVLSGIYTWRFVVDNEPLVFEARFSYVVDTSKPSPILHHHSSQVPRML